jgi:hypothetical protein
MRRTIMPEETANSSAGNWRAVLAVVLVLVILVPVGYSVFVRVTAVFARVTATDAEPPNLEREWAKLQTAFTAGKISAEDAYARISAFQEELEAKAGPPEAPDSKYRECIRPTKYMREHHWELLKGLREKVVRDGIRGDLVAVETISQGETETIKVEQSLDGCWRCHQSKVRFCDRCHNAASVRPDCFGCHYYPDVDEFILKR